MKVSQFLVSTAAAVTVVSAIGFAYAQSGDNTKSTMQNEATTTSQAPTPSGTTGDGSMTNERMARADRN